MRVADLLKGSRKVINPPYKSKDFIILLITFVILISIPITAIATLQSRDPRGRAAPVVGTMYLSPASLSIDQGDTFSVAIRENSSTELVNAVQVDLNYDPADLDFVTVNGTGSAFGLEVENTGGGGLVRIVRGVTGGDPPATGDQLVATVTFRARLSPGATTVSFAAESRLMSSVDNTDILNTTTPGIYTIINPPPSVSITSPINGVVVSDSVTVTATVDDDQGINQVEFYIDSSLKSTDTVAPYSYSFDSNTLTDANHTVMARVYDTQGANVSDSITLRVDNAPPDDPTGLTATAAGVDRVDLSWNPGSDDIGVVGYEVYRNGVKIAPPPNITGTSFSDTGLSPGTTYSYYVKAIDGQGNISGPSSTVQGITDSIQGDINNDGFVDSIDLTILLSNWGLGCNQGDINTPPDCVIDVVDLSILLSNWTG